MAREAPEREREPDATVWLSARASKWIDEQPCALSCHTTVPFVLAGDRFGAEALLASTVQPAGVRLVPDVPAMAQWLTRMSRSLLQGATIATIGGPWHEVCLAWAHGLV